jgi:hypothetical protein
MILDYLFLPVVFLIGSITSYQDYKYSKIRNKWILWGLAWALSVYLLLCLWLLSDEYFTLFHRAKDFMSFVYIHDALLNAFISLAIGYLIWYFDLWSAGDAKLFFVFSLLLPLTHYSSSYLPYFPSFALLINVFAPAMLFLFLQKIFKITKDMAGRVRCSRIPRISWTKIRTYLGKNYQTLFKSSLSFMLIFLSFQLFRQMFQNHLNISQGLSSIIFLSFFGASSLFRKALKNNYVLILFTCLISFYMAISGSASVREIGLMISNSLIFMFAFPIVIFVFSYSEKKTYPQKLPFAVWLFLGVIITLIMKGSFASHFLNQ